jgi:hypothetical protein
MTGTEPLDAAFTEADLAGLPEPVRRYLRAAIAPGTAPTTAVRLKMRGHIKLGRWLPFTAHEMLDPVHGFVWKARTAGLITGSDRYLDGAGAMDWKLAGLVTVAHADGPDTSRSAAGRAAGEAIWAPTALLPSTGVTWSVIDETRITARRVLGGTPVGVTLTLDPHALPRSVVFERWGDPDRTGTWNRYPFGGEFTAHHTFDGLTIPSAGRLGWHYGTDRWTAGQFFRYTITDLHRCHPHA